MRQETKVKVGLVGLGLEAYWAQFEGLEQRLLGYVAEVAQKLGGAQRTIVNLGLVDSVPSGVVAGHACRTNDVDVLVIYVTTYALSSTVLPIILRAKVPVILLNLQPEAAIDYGRLNRMKDRTAMTGEWLAFCAACPVPEIANVLRRLQIPFHQVTGVLDDDPACWAEMEQWMLAAEVKAQLEHSRLGLMGHYYGGMLDIATDLAQVSGRFGVQIEMVELNELSGIRAALPEATIGAKLEEFAEFFAIEPECEPAEQRRAARTAAALDVFVARHDLNMMAYYEMGSGNAENEDTMSSIILGTSMLTARGIAVAGEYEVKNVIAMKMLDLLGAGGSFTEYYAVDFAQDVLLMGHDGPGHALIGQDKIKVKPLQVYHGKVGSGLSVEMSVKHGPVTLLSVVEDSARGFKLVFAEGESVAGEILEIGNTNSRYRFPLGARGFLESWNAQGPAHHCAVGLGHLGRQLEKIAALLEMPFVRVC